MRISTNQIFETGTRNMQRNQIALNKLQNQISTGLRVLSPEDDPVAAAQALVINQSIGVNAEHTGNQSKASNQLGLVNTQLTSLENVLQNARVLVLQAGNTSTLNTSDRASIASSLESSLSEIIGIANSKDGSGDYMFSGFQGATLPFAVDALAPALPPSTTSPVGYYGDDGERLLQVSSSRQIAVNLSGNDVFMSARQGNGTFQTATGGNLGGGVNQGTGIIDAGSVLDAQQWQAAVNSFAWSAPTNPALQVRFSVVGDVTTYQLYDVSVPATPAPISTALPFTPGQAITLASTNPPAASATSFGSQVVIQGSPKNNDTFAISPSRNQSVFQTMQNLIAVLRSNFGSGGYSTTEYSNALAAQLTNLDQSLETVRGAQTIVGSRLSELDSLTSTSSGLDAQYQDTLKDLIGVDYAKAISDFKMQQTYLEAAQASFASVSALSLFNYL